MEDVVPALQTNSEGLKKVLEDLVKQYTGKQTELEKWKVRRIVVVTITSAEFRFRRRTISKSSSNNHIHCLGMMVVWAQDKIDCQKSGL